MVTVDDTLKMLVVQSANDIAVALAEGVSSVRTLPPMNASTHSACASHWVNPDGLPTRPDLLGARHGGPWRGPSSPSFRPIRTYFQIQAIQSGKQVIRTHNALVYHYPGADGMKTSFICASRLQRSGHRLPEQTRAGSRS